MNKYRRTPEEVKEAMRERSKADIAQWILSHKRPPKRKEEALYGKFYRYRDTPEVKNALRQIGIKLKK